MRQGDPANRLQRPNGRLGRGPPHRRFGRKVRIPESDVPSVPRATQSVLAVPPGYLICVITGDPRRETPEERVRQRFARSLMEEFGYRKGDIEIEFTINMGAAKKRVDIAVFPPDAAHKQENIYVIVEVKK